MRNPFKHRSPAKKLFSRVRANDLRGVHRELATGVPVDSPDARGRTALCIAAKYGFAEVAEVLIGAGANVNVRGHAGKTPIFYAVHSGSETTLSVLVDAGADLEAVDDSGNTPVQYAKGMLRNHLAEVLAEKLLASSA